MWRNIIIIMVAVGLAGCATQKKPSLQMQVQDLQAQNVQLQQEAQQKDAQIQSLHEQLTTVSRAGIAKETMVQGAAVTQPTPKKIQRALKKAGFYNGEVDGKIGKATKRAISEFQKANNLNPDGMVGKKTWTKLSQYLE